MRRSILNGVVSHLATDLEFYDVGNAPSTLDESFAYRCVPTGLVHWAGFALVTSE
jgi:hypothetical protein